MSSKDKSIENVKLVQSTKEIMNQMGIEIKTTQVYELYSKLIGYNNWNVAQSKKVNFLDKIIYENYSLEDLVLNHKNLSFSSIIKEVHKRMGHKVIRDLDDKIQPSGVCQIIKWKNQDVAIMARGKFLRKHILKLYEEMKYNKCERGILYTSLENFSYSLHEFAKKIDIEIVDYEDLLRHSRRIDLEKIEK